jgi:hypothetical protein
VILTIRNSFNTVQNLVVDELFVHQKLPKLARRNVLEFTVIIRSTFCHNILLARGSTIYGHNAFEQQKCIYNEK